MKKIKLLIILLFCITGLISAKNPYNSFNRLTKIGFVVGNTASLSTYETEIYNTLNYSGCNITLIDTSYMDDSTYNVYDSTWSTLNLVIISRGTYTDTTASPDINLSGGIGHVNLICLEPAFWDSLGLPDSAGVINQTSVAFGDTTYHVDSLWTDEENIQIVASGGNDTMFTIAGTGIDSTEGYLITTSLTDTVVVLKDFGNAKRCAWGIVGFEDFKTNSNNGWTVFNRLIAYLYGTYTDSLFDVSLLVESSYGDLEYVRHYFELNGHTTTLTIISTMTTSDLSNMDLVYNYAELLPTDTEWDTVLLSNKPIFTNRVGKNYFDEVYGYTRNTDSTHIAGARHQALNGYIDGSYIQMYSSNQSCYYESNQWADTRDSIYVLADTDNSTYNNYISIAKKSRKEIWYGAYELKYYTDAGFDLFSQYLGWLLDDEPLQPDNLTLTVTAVNSARLSWTDWDGTANHGIKVYSPDTTWWTTTHTTEVDTVEGFMPNDWVVVDVAVISGTDTLFSLDGVQTDYTVCLTPAPISIEGLSDTSIVFTINGYLLSDDFSDTLFNNEGVVWTIYDGDWQINSRYWELESISGQGYTSYLDTNVIATQYYCDYRYAYNNNRNVEWNMQFHFSDSLGVWDDNYLYFYLMADSISTKCPYQEDEEPDGYWIRIKTHYQDNVGEIALYRHKSGYSNKLAYDTTWADPATNYPKSFKWNTLRVARDFDGSPKDTSINWDVVLNGDTLFEYTESNTDSMVFDQEGIIIKTNKAFVTIDNIFIRYLTPGLNNDSTKFALQDSSGTLKYINYAANPDTIASSTAIWGLYSDWHTLADTLSQLNPYTTYNLRLKAKNGR